MVMGILCIVWMKLVQKQNIIPKLGTKNTAEDIPAEFFNLFVK